VPHASRQMVTSATTPLRLIREALGVSQAELARRMGLDRSLVSRAERGRIATWPRFRREAADALGIDEHLLFPEHER
jgi:transcriptional regulator with XRE-family HTH domain